jgi:hypothetical protein
MPLCELKGETVEHELMLVLLSGFVFGFIGSQLQELLERVERDILIDGAIGACLVVCYRRT